MGKTDLDEINESINAPDQAFFLYSFLGHRATGENVMVRIKKKAEEIQRKLNMKFHSGTAARGSHLSC